MNFSKKCIILILLVVFFLLYAIANYRANAPIQPNVILIYLDALRPDHLGCYGYKRNTSANIDQLAQAGILCKDVISQAPSTGHSVYSAMFSKYASNLFSPNLDRSATKQLSLTEVLKQNGYTTVAISSSPIVSPLAGGLGQGFDVFDTSVCRGETWNSRWRNPEGVISKSIDWLQKNHLKKFFLFLYIMDPHDPYRSPEPYNSMYDSGYVGKEEIAKGNPHAYEERILKGIEVDLDKRDIEHLVALYDGEITYADVQIGRLLSYLDQLNIRDHTLIVLTADHGEEFFEHGGLKHCHTLYNEAIKAPLIFNYPALIHKGTIVDNEIIQSIDIAPTICDIVNIEPPEQFQGRSALPLIEKKDVHWRNYALSESYHVDAKALITKEWKYIDHFGSPYIGTDFSDKYLKGKELYNLKNDPEEKSNIYNQEQEIAAWMHALMISILPDNERKRIEEGGELTVEETTAEALKSLGYIQ